MKPVFIFLTDGFEEIEAISTIDILRRAEINVQSVSLTDNLTVTGGHGVKILADVMFANADYSNAELLILPGGTVKINEHDGLKRLVKSFADVNKMVAAICAAPMVLGGLGLLNGKRATAYPGFEQYLVGAEFVEQPVVVDGNIVTGRGPGFTQDFALKIVELISGKNKRDEVAKGLLVD